MSPPPTPLIPLIVHTRNVCLLDIARTRQCPPKNTRSSPSHHTHKHTYTTYFWPEELFGLLSSSSRSTSSAKFRASLLKRAFLIVSCAAASTWYVRTRCARVRALQCQPTLHDQPMPAVVSSLWLAIPLCSEGCIWRTWHYTAKSLNLVMLCPKRLQWFKM